MRTAFAFLWVLLSTASGADVVLLARGSKWQYVSELLPNWQLPTHNDGVAPWKTGMAPFTNNTGSEFAGGTGIPLDGRTSYFRAMVPFNASIEARVLTCRFGLASERAAVVFLNGAVVNNDTVGMTAKYFNREVPIALVNGPNTFAVQLRTGPVAVFDLEVACTELPPPVALPNGKNLYVAQKSRVTGGVVDCKCITTNQPAVLRLVLRDGAGAPAGLSSSMSPFSLSITDPQGQAAFELQTATFSVDGTQIDFFIKTAASAVLNVTILDITQGGAIAPTPLIIMASSTAIVPTVALQTVAQTVGGMSTTFRATAPASARSTAPVTAPVTADPSQMMGANIALIAGASGTAGAFLLAVVAVIVWRRLRIKPSPAHNLERAPSPHYESTAAAFRPDDNRHYDKLRPSEAVESHYAKTAADFSPNDVNHYDILRPNES